ncbi:glutathione S-transferase N-terminal domain-containing protein [Vibrio sp. ZSDE26]|uniref:Glutathione S-transferase N-terminal domain-containing protein n=1 Tax=Vibrio amylolyticus TaxID=2847292 RepID=A0A9X1XLC5_9VIBR|nr:glutathione S-transferase N-terminal domain-containing protein [Vibrio amylolyticus]MCK6264315.1 glutathione S-transferase N-terminal domain-containing protein [Vibrio amylolyticus]
MELIVGRDSTWSLRAWLCAKIAKVEVNELIIDLTKPDYKQTLLSYSPSGLVPALNVGESVIHDSLAIIEFFNEQSSGALFPTDELQRAEARSLCSELHSGFFQLRQQCPFSLDPVEPLAELASDLNVEIKRVESIFEQAQQPFMYQHAGAVDAFYSILAFRLQSYGITFNGKAGEYQQSLLNWPLLNQAIEVAMEWRKS